MMRILFACFSVFVSFGMIARFVACGTDDDIVYHEVTLKKLYDFMDKRMGNMERILNDIHKKTQNIDAKVNDNSKKIETLDWKLNDTHKTVGYIRNETDDMKSKLNDIYKKTENIDAKVNDTYKMTTVMERTQNDTFKERQANNKKLNNFEKGTKNIEGKLNQVYDYIQKETKDINRKLHFLISFFENEGIVKDNYNQSNASSCSKSKNNKTNSPKILNTIRQSLGIVGKEEKLGCKNHTGNEYVLMFPRLYNDTSKLEILVTSRIDAIVHIESTYPGVNQTVQVKATQGRVVSIPTDVIIQINRTYSGSIKGIFVRSNSQISVYGVMYNGSVYGHAFMAIPTRFLSTTYFVDYFYYPKYKEITIVALEDGTRVNITPFWNNNVQRSRTQELSRLNTYRITTGYHTYSLSSNRVIGLMTGAITKWLKHLFFIPPKPSLGNVFIVPHFKIQGGRRSISIQSFLDLRCNITIQSVYIHQTSNFTFGKRYVLDLSSPNTVETSLPAALVILNSIYLYSSTSSNLFIPAISQYSNHYKFLTPFTLNFDHYALIMIKVDDIDRLIFDGQTVHNMPFDAQTVSVKDTLYNVIYLNITAGLHEVYHIDDDVTFGLIALGFSSHDMYALPVGLYLGEQTCTDP